MSNRQIQEKYIQALEQSCPDMDRLWLQISRSEPESSDISPFVKAQKECSAPKKRITRAAVCAAALIIAALGLRSIPENTEFEADSRSNVMYADTQTRGEGNSAAVYPEADSDSADEDAGVGVGENGSIYENTVAAVSSWEYSSRCDHAASYSDLTFAPANSPAATGIEGAPEEYFVEEAVLADTDYFLDCKIISAERSEDAVRYEAQIIHFISDNIAEMARRVTLVCRSPYALREGREYLLPIKETGGERLVVFESAPQIEFTADRQVVCHNGWEFAKEGTAIEYPKVYSDDFFFDRMNITAESSLEGLFDKWRKLSADSRQS